MICSTTYRTILSVVGSMIMTLGTFSMLQASAPWDQPRTQVVSYQDADLNNSAKAARLYKRIHLAAEKVCREFSRQDTSSRARLRECVDGAVASAVARVNHPKLSSLHSATIDRWQLASERVVKPGV